MRHPFSFWKKSAAAVFDPATLSLTGWWRNYPGSSPWSGTTSVGTSASQSLSEATHPPGAGAALNSHGTASYNGTNSQFTASGTEATYLASAVGSGWVLFNATAATTDAGVGSRLNNPQFFVDSVGSFGIGFSTAGIHVVTVDPSNGTNEKVIACATGAWHVLQWEYVYTSPGLTLSIALDSGGFQQLTSSFGSGLSGSRTGTMTSGGKLLSTAPFFNGLIADMGISSAALNNTDFTNVRSYINARYGLSL